MNKRHETLYSYHQINSLTPIGLLFLGKTRKNRKEKIEHLLEATNTKNPNKTFRFKYDAFYCDIFAFYSAIQKYSIQEKTSVISSVLVEISSLIVNSTETYIPLRLAKRRLRSTGW